jgi:uncharacterized protein
LISEIKGIVEIGSKDKDFFVRIRPHEDSLCDITVSDDNMSASLTIIPAKGKGKIISLKKVFSQIQQHGISFGIQESIISQAVDMAQHGKPINDIHFAFGIEPVHAQGQRLILHVEKKEKKHVKILENGRADFKNHDTICIVKKDQLIGEISPHSENAIDGTDVFGTSLPAQQQNDSITPQLNNIRKEKQADGSIKLLAEIEGEFVRTSKTVEVRKLHIIKGNVGSETGNIKFPGSILIKGGVKSGFQVISQGDLSVADTIEESLLSAEGNIYIKKGIKGRNKAVIRARRSIYCQFAEHAILLSVEDIRIESSAFHCSIKCNSSILARKEKGTIMGGTVKAKKGLNVFNLGSVSEISTTVSFGQDYLIEDQIEIEEKEVSKLQETAGQIDNQMKFLNKARQENLSKLVPLREEKLQILKRIEKHNLKLFALREKFEEHFPAEVIVRGTVFPGVVLESHGRRYSIKENKTAVKFIFNAKRGKIEEKYFSLAKRSRFKPHFKS